MNPRRDCSIVLEPHAQERRLQRGLALENLETMVREGLWAPLPDRITEIAYGKWTIRVKVGPCIISVATVVLRR